MDSITKTWVELSKLLNVAPQTLSKWRRQEESCPRDSKSLSDWQVWIKNKKSIGKGSGRLQMSGEDYKLEDIQDLKAKLIQAQERKEQAIAQMRELELSQKKGELIPATEATEAVLKILTPLRRLLDALPKLVAPHANPNNSHVAERAVRQVLDEHVFGEMQKILSEQKTTNVL
jgi:phage terminase Nu1 subunit (DNA packaging protein)